MDAVVMAGGIPSEGEPLYPLTRGSSKALLNVAGKPMVQWVLNALGSSERVERAVVVGLEEPGGLSFPREIHYLPNQGGFLENILCGARKVMELDPKAPYLLCISSDIPAITGSMIDWVLGEALSTEGDFYYCAIERGDMEARFPGCRRTFYRFRDMEVCGGDLAVINTSVFSTGKGIWQRLMEARKSRLKTAAAIGFDVLLLFLIRRLTIDELVRKASRRLDVRGRAIHCPFPEVGMDVDKPFQLEILEKALAAQGSP